MSDNPQVTPPAITPTPPSGRYEGPTETGKILALFGYLTGAVALVAILIEPYKNERFVRLHAIQALALAVVAVVLDTLLWWTVLVPIALFALQVIGAVKSYQGEFWEIPFIHGIVKDWV